MIPAALALALFLLAAPAAAEVGETSALYERHCADCHGAGGRGDGPAAGMLSPRPRDFTTGQYKIRSTPSGSLPAVEDMIRAIRVGLPGTSMPGYADLLPPEAIRRLALYVLNLAPAGAIRQPPILIGPAPEDSAEVRDRGARLYRSAGCVACHGEDGQSRGWKPVREGLVSTPRPTNLAEPWTFRGGPGPEEVTRRILTGLDGAAMPSFASTLTPAQAWEVARFVASLARTPIWEEPDPGKVRTAGVATDPLERGRYLVAAMQCPLCHTPISDKTGAYYTDHFLAGGMRVGGYPWGVWYSRNLTSDPETGLGQWSEEEISRAVTRGIARDGRPLHAMAMSWPWFSRLTPTDARAIAVYLKSLPLIRNLVPPAERIPAVEAVGGKILVLLGRKTAVEFWGGNAAADPGLRASIPVPAEQRRKAGLWGWGSLVLVGAVALIALVKIRRRWGRLLLAPALLLALGWGTLVVWPPMDLLGSQATVRWLFLGTPRLPDALTGAPRALAERGEYLATIAPCGLCHTPATAMVGFLTSRTMAGGMEARWRVYGRAVSTNLTPHPSGGIAEIPDAVLLRAMRSGIGHDGRRMHWQAMSWDIGSRWSEEDQRAMLAYLRALRPVPGRVPPPRGPEPGDPAADAFYYGDAADRRR
jgi:mono/diheme cytochrome c family protein